MEDVAERVRFLRRGDVRLAVREWGPDDATPVVLVHGYPDTSGMWEPVAARLADQHHVIAYDVRGAGGSSAPRRVRDYRLVELMADLTAVIDAFAGGRRVHLVGHDWGAIQGWEAVTTPDVADRIASYTAFGAPCLDHAAYWGRRGRDGAAKGRQLRKSWYVAMFHLPGVSELAWHHLVGRNWRSILTRVEHLAVDEAFPAPTLTGDAQHGMKLYRANILPRSVDPAPRPTGVPVQILAAAHDRYVSPELLASARGWVDDLTWHDVDGGHWLARSHPDLVADHIRTFASKTST